MKRNSIVYIFIIIILVLFDVYLKYIKEAKRKTITKYLEHVMLYEGSKSRITNVIWDKNLVAITIDIQSGKIDEVKKDILGERIGAIISGHICSDEKLLDLVRSGYMISIDISSNGEIKSFANILIEADTCW